MIVKKGSSKIIGVGVPTEALAALASNRAAESEGTMGDLTFCR